MMFTIKDRMRTKVIEQARKEATEAVITKLIEPQSKLKSYRDLFRLESYLHGSSCFD